MARFELAFRRPVAKDLRSIPNEDVARILQRIEALRDDPFPPDSRRLSAGERYRIRQGVYRILYEVDGVRLTVLVVKIAPRREAYRS